MDIDWEIPVIEGQIPVGTQLAIPRRFWMGSSSSEGYFQGVLGQYLEPNSNYRPVGKYGEGDWIYFGIKGMFVGGYCPLNECVIMAISRQPIGWPRHNETRPPIDLELSMLKKKYTMSDEDFAYELNQYLRTFRKAK